MKKLKKKPRTTTTTPSKKTGTTPAPTPRQSAIREITSSVLDSCVSGGGVRAECPHKRLASY